MKNYKKIFSKLVILSCILCNLAVSNINAVVYRTSQEINIDNRNAFIVKMLKYTSVTAGIVTVGVGSLYAGLKYGIPKINNFMLNPIRKETKEKIEEMLPLTYNGMLPLTYNGMLPLTYKEEKISKQVQCNRGAGVKEAKKKISGFKILENTNFNSEEIKDLRERETEKQINKEYKNSKNEEVLDESLEANIPLEIIKSITRDMIESAIREFSEEQSKAQKITDLTLSQLNNSSSIEKSTK